MKCKICKNDNNTYYHLIFIITGIILNSLYVLSQSFISQQPNEMNAVIFLLYMWKNRYTEELNIFTRTAAFSEHRYRYKSSSLSSEAQIIFHKYRKKNLKIGSNY